jgi:serine/threonine-protein kinase
MIGVRLGRWVIDSELGRGGMGAVYLAHDEAPHDGAPGRAAVKVLAAELAVDPGFRERFRREVEILRQLNHPHIVRHLDSGEDKGRHYLAMEYVDGPTLEDLRLRRGRLPWPEVVDLALQVAPALKHAHDRGVIHRDLKPSNLLRAAPDPAGGHPHGVVKLTDFGIASLFAGRHLTLPGGVIGTAEYLSPEQAAGKPATPRSDLYSFGVVLYTLLTGRTPFEGDAVSLLHKHRFGQFDRPLRVVPEIPPGLDEVVCELLEKDPDERPGDAGALFRWLDALRRKLERQRALDEADTEDAPAPGEAPRTGPATLMSRLMRVELERQNRGGPVRRFLDRPAVLVTLFVLTVGLLAWLLWPAGPEALFRRGAALMASPDPDDWYEGWNRYLKPLEERFPGHGHQAEVAEYRRQYENWEAARDAGRRARNAGPMTEAQWFYQQGLRLRQRGDEAGARQVWQALREAFGGVPSEAPWVRLAEEELARQGDVVERRLGPVREAVRQARRLREEGKEKEAEAVLRGLRELYAGEQAVEGQLKAK